MRFHLDPAVPYAHDHFAKWPVSQGRLTRDTLARRTGWGGNRLVVLSAGLVVEVAGRGMAGTNFVCEGASYFAERVETVAS